jgi:hypothetical protein
MAMLLRLGRGLQEAAAPLLQGLSHTAACWPSRPQLHTDSAAEGQPTASTSGSAQRVFLAKTDNRLARKHFKKYRYGKPAPSELKELLQRFAATQGNLIGQHILAKVLKVTGRGVVLDPQFFGVNTIDFADLAGSELYDAHGEPKQGAAAGSMQPGDHVKVRVAHLYTPFGDMQLEPSRLTDESKMKLIWQELGAAQRAGRAVEGRVLNACRGGYAVGVAGFVALLPYTRTLPDTARRIGVLQEFYITKMDEAKQLMLLSCTQQAAPSPGRAGLSNLYSNIPSSPAAAAAGGSGGGGGWGGSGGSGSSWGGSSAAAQQQQ